MEFLFRRKGPSDFSYSSTAEEVTDGIDASGLTAIVTGASSGIGAETARVLALRGAHVIIGVRNTASGNKVREAIVREIPDAKVDVMDLDLSSLESVKKFASEFEASGNPLHILINNAGVMIWTPPFKLSKDNIELHFATNYLGHFYLTNLLLETMKRTSQICRKEGRIVNVSSFGQRLRYREGIRFDRVNDIEGFHTLDYSQSKLANILHSNELARRLKEDGVNITANSLNPGAITTNIFRALGVMEGVVNMLIKYMGKNVQQGAATTCYVALHPQVKGLSGQYFVDSNIGKATKQAMDMDLAKKLWDFSTNLVDSKFTKIYGEKKHMKD